MVDIHSHILWALDDGAQTLEESLAMLKVAGATGTSDIVATPHANDDFVFDHNLVRERIATLREESGGYPIIHQGCDFHLSYRNIEGALRDPSRYTINSFHYLMVELPETIIPPYLSPFFLRMRELGVWPVITHPERNRAFYRGSGTLEDWIGSGCYVQVTAQSLEGHFGRAARSTAWRLLEEQKVHFIASDAHNTSFRPPRLDTAFALVAERFGLPTARHLFEENPRKTLSGEPLGPSPRLPVTQESGSGFLSGSPFFRFFQKKS